MDEKQIEELVETKIKDALSKVENASESISERHNRRRHNHSEFWGLILFVIGFILLARNLHWFRWDIPFWPIVLIAGGAYLIYSSSRRD